MLVDDHPGVRQTLARLLQAAPDLAIVGEAADGKAAVVLAHNARPDVVLMDVSMPVMNGIDATRIIHSELPDIRIIRLSMSDSKEHADAMFAAGAVAYFSMSGPSSALLESIRANAILPKAD